MAESYPFVYKYHICSVPCQCLETRLFSHFQLPLIVNSQAIMYKFLYSHVFLVLPDINLRVELLQLCLNCEQIPNLRHTPYHDCHLVDSDFIAQSLVGHSDLSEVTFDGKITCKGLYKSI